MLSHLTGQGRRQGKSATAFLSISLTMDSNELSTKIIGAAIEMHNPARLVLDGSFCFPASQRKTKKYLNLSVFAVKF
jgi:hypothetical protein